MDRINLPAYLLIFPIILLAIHTDTLAFVHPARMVAAGEKYTIGLTAFGTVVAVGDNVYGECDTTPANGFTDIVQIDAGFYHTIGLKANGTVVAVGENNWGQCNTSWTLSFPSIDSDGDGVSDFSDRCIATPVGSAVDSHGCLIKRGDYDRDGDVDGFELSGFAKDFGF